MFPSFSSRLQNEAICAATDFVTKPHHTSSVNYGISTNWCPMETETRIKNLSCQQDQVRQFLVGVNAHKVSVWKVELVLFLCTM